MPATKTRTRTTQPRDRDTARTLTTQSMQVRAATANEEQRSVEAVITTETPVMVYDWSRNEVIEEILRSDAVTLPPQVVLLDSHSRWSMETTLGSVRDFRREGANIVGRLLFARDDVSQAAFDKIRDGHITDVSAGYRVKAFETVAPGKTVSINGKTYTAGTRSLRVVTDWEIREVSVVAIGADPTAKVREETESPTGDNDMATKTDGNPVPENPSPPVDVAKERADAVKAERARVEAIRKLVTKEDSESTHAVVERCIADGSTVEAATAKVLEAVRAAGVRPVSPDIKAGEPQIRNLERELEDMIVERAMPGHRRRDGTPLVDEKSRENARKWAGIGLHAMVRQFLLLSGEREIPENPEALLRRTISTANVPNLLGSAATKLLHAAYDANIGTAVQWAGRKEVPDFKTYTGIKFDGVAELEEVGDGGELKHGSFIESTETFKLKTHGKRVTISRQQFVNDDLDGFARAPVILGRAAARSIDAAMYGTSYLGAASGVGPTLNEDGKALFATDHSGPTGYVPPAWPSGGVSNYKSSGAALGEAGLSAARTLFRKIRGLDGQLINAAPEVLLVPAELEFTAARLIRSSTLAPSGQTTSTAMEGVFNPHAGAFRLIVEPRLDLISGGTTSYYLIANPMQVPSLSIVYLRGQAAPTLERKDPTDVLGIGWWIYFDFGISVDDWRGIVRAKA